MPSTQVVQKQLDAKNIGPALRMAFERRVKAIGIHNCVEVRVTETRKALKSSDYAILLIGEREEVRSASRRIENIVQTQNL